MSRSFREFKRVCLVEWLFVFLEMMEGDLGGFNIGVEGVRFFILLF